jgi:3'-phosphoadenosine 5'-phosphosulfate sulfotransferase (PAPS reductase)/FAD synthetase
MIEETKEFIREKAHRAMRPAVMCSFGKDSMVMAALIRDALTGVHSLNGQHFPLTHAFPLPVIYHRDPWFPQKHEFADSQIKAWAMEVYDFLPLYAGVKTNDAMIEPVARYQLGTHTMDLPKNLCEPEEYPRRDYICGLRDWVARPTATLVSYPWDLLFIGHKDSDVDPFDGAVPLKDFTAVAGDVTLAFPLKRWTDNDVFAYAKANRVPIDSRRSDKWYDNDYVHACVACIDPREKAEEVFCPKLKKNVKNVGKYVLQLKADAKYIEK